MRRSPAIALAVALSVLLVVGCGGDQEFIDDYNDATAPLSRLNRDVAGTVNGARGSSDDQVAKRFDGLVARAEKVNHSLADLHPPEDAEQPFADLKTALRKATGDLRHASSAAAESDAREFAAATTALARHGNEIIAAETALKRKVEG